MHPRQTADCIQDKDQSSAVEEADDIASLPFVFSVKSQRSLKSMLANMLDVLDSKDRLHHDMALRDIASTLLRERSVLPFCRAIVGHNKEAVRSLTFRHWKSVAVLLPPMENVMMGKTLILPGIPLSMKATYA